jgi:hypothetical protein
VVGAVAAAIILVVGGYAVTRLWGGGLPVGGPPQLTEDQFDQLAQDILPGGGAGSLWPHTPSDQSASVIDQLCPATRTAGEGLRREASGYLELKLFDTSDQAEAYVKTWADCVNDFWEDFDYEGTFEAVELMENDVLTVEIDDWGYVMQQLAVYGNVVVIDFTASVGFPNGADWNDFAHNSFKNAVDQAARS